MADISFDPIDTQELFTTGSLNNRFSAGAGSLQVAINDVESDALAPGALNEHHLPSLALFRSEISQVAGGQYTYTNTPWPSGYAVVDSNGETGGGTDLEIDFGATYNLTTGQAQAVFVLADMYVQHVRRAATTYNDLDGVAFRIQAYNGASWQTIGRTERLISAQIFGGDAASKGRAINVKVPIRTLITSADLSNNSITKVRVQVAVWNGGSGATNTTATLLSRSLTAIILQSTRT
jgi:hypothetical protein